MLPTLTAAEALERLRSRPIRVVHAVPAMWVVRDQRVRGARPGRAADLDVWLSGA
jgi:hypothetical protein